MKPFTTIAVLLFVLIAVLQAVRFFMQWDVTINGTAIPVWASGVAALIAAALAILVWRENRSRAS